MFQGVEVQLQTNIDSSDKVVDMLYGHFRVMPSPFQVSQMGWEAEDAAFATDRRGPAAFATDRRERGRTLPSCGLNNGVGRAHGS